MMYTIYALSSNPISTITVKAEGATNREALNNFGAGRHGRLLREGDLYAVIPYVTANLDAPHVRGHIADNALIFKWQPPTPPPPSAHPVTFS